MNEYKLENQLKFLNPVEVKANQSSETVILAIVAEPTVDEAGNQALGGVGESYLAEAFAKIFGTETIGFGEASRELANQKAGRKLSEVEFEEWRQELAEKAETDLDYQIDQSLITKAVETAQVETTAVVSSKIFAYLYLDWLSKVQEQELPTMVAIGVTVDDHLANFRVWLRREKSANGKVENKNLKHKVNSLREIKEQRQARFKTDSEIFENAYPKVVADYGRESLKEKLNWEFDNSQSLTPEEMEAVALEFLNEIVEKTPQLAPAILNSLTAI